MVISCNPNLETAVKVGAAVISWLVDFYDVFIANEAISEYWKVIILYLCHHNIHMYAFVFISSYFKRPWLDCILCAEQ